MMLNRITDTYQRIAGGALAGVRPCACIRSRVHRPRQRFLFSQPRSGSPPARSSSNPVAT